MSTRRALLLATLLAAPSVPAFAQGSAFLPGELFLYSPGLQEPGYSGPGILRANPVTGASSILVQTFFAQSNIGTMAFDPYRQRVVFSGTLPGQNNKLWFVDGNGNLQDALPQLPSVHCEELAPAGNGRIYMEIFAGGVGPFAYLEADGSLHTLFDSDGVTPLAASGPMNDPTGAIFDPATNALFFAFHDQNGVFPGDYLRVRKVPLSADGTKVGDTPIDAYFNISNNGGELANGWSYGPNGTLILSAVVADNATALPRLLQVDPVTVQITPWGLNGGPPPTPAHLLCAGAYSASIGKVVQVDAWNKTLCAFAQGSTGGLGTTIATAPATFPNTNTQINLVSVPSDEQVSTSYCTAKTTTIPGCLASIQSFGLPKASNPAGFHVIAGPTPGGTPGLFIWSSTGPASIPFAGGWLCLQSPVVRGAAIAPKGNFGVCNGSFPMPGTGFGSDWVLGAHLHVQAWFRDPGNQLDSSLSDALTFTVQ